MIINYESALRDFIQVISSESQHTAITQSPVCAEVITFVVSASKYRAIAEYLMEKGRGYANCSLPAEFFVSGNFYLMHDYRIQCVKPCRDRDEIIITVFTNKPCTQEEKAIFKADELKKYDSKNYHFEFVSFHPFSCRVYPSNPEFGFEGKGLILRYGERETKVAPKDNNHLCYGKPDGNFNLFRAKNFIQEPFILKGCGEDSQIKWSPTPKQP